MFSFKKMPYYLGKKGLLNWMPDEKYLKLIFKTMVGYELNLSEPKTFNEKLQWLKLNDRKPEYTTMVDKYSAKDYVADIIGSDYIIPTLGMWDSFDEIDFDELPNQFVLKCTHDSGGLVICTDKNKFDYKAARKKITKCLKYNYYYAGREWVYKDVKPRIIAEKYMCDAINIELNDYKLMCFDGEVKCSFVCSDRFSEGGLRVTFYDKDWNVLPFERHYPKSNVPISKPLNYDKMISFAEKLAQNIPFVRVDFYEIAGKLYFGELTFFPGGGFEEFEPQEKDLELGSWIKLPGGVFSRE